MQENDEVGGFFILQQRRMSCCKGVKTLIFGLF